MSRDPEEVPARRVEVHHVVNDKHSMDTKSYMYLTTEAKTFADSVSEDRLP